MLIRPLVPILIQEELKPVFPILLVVLSLTSSIISYFNSLYFYANPVQFDIDIAKIKFVIEVAQDWFEVGLNQED